MEALIEMKTEVAVILSVVVGVVVINAAAFGILYFTGIIRKIKNAGVARPKSARKVSIVEFFQSKVNNILYEEAYSESLSSNCPKRVEKDFLDFFLNKDSFDDIDAQVKRNIFFSYGVDDDHVE